MAEKRDPREPAKGYKGARFWRIYTYDVDQAAARIAKAKRQAEWAKEGKNGLPD